MNSENLGQSRLRKVGRSCMLFFFVNDVNKFLPSASSTTYRFEDRGHDRQDRVARMDCSFEHWAESVQWLFCGKVSGGNGQVDKVQRCSHTQIILQGAVNKQLLCQWFLGEKRLRSMCYSMCVNSCYKTFRVIKQLLMYLRQHALLMLLRRKSSDSQTFLVMNPWAIFCPSSTPPLTVLM